MAQAVPSYLEILNPEQREAVFHTGESESPPRPLLILAGAGSGKTRVITTKIAWLIREMGVDPRSILAVTFTNKAAREMAERARLIDERAGDAMLRTFHSFGAWFLRRNGALADLPPGFVIYDDDDMVSLLSTIMEGSPRAEVKAVAHSIARAKDYFLSPGDPELDLIDYRKFFRQIYTQYEERLAKIGNADFGDLIKKPVEILRNNPEVAARFHSRFKVIMVDEYQDANIAQFELLKELYGPDTYLCVVGDDDQSIYRFRGAEVKNILEFPDRFAGADIVRLERNYRSTAPILRAASSVVDHNSGRLGKTLRAERSGGDLPVLIFLPDQDEEAAYCARLIEKAVKQGGKQDKACRYADWAILYRTNAQSLGFETELLRRHIPYRIVGSLKFYEREEIKDALALLSFLVNPKDEVAFRRVVNKPSRGVGPAAVGRIVEEALSGRGNENELDMETSAGDLGAAARRISGELSAKARSGVGDFLKAVEAGRQTLDIKEAPEGTVTKTGLRSGEGLSVCVVTMAEESGLAEYHLTHDEIAGNQRLSNLQELANAASLYPATVTGLLEFLEHIELDRAMEEKSAGAGDDIVTLITLHNTKGLEFRRVIMTGVEQGVFPREDKSGDDLEEERRLFYVGATRAMDELYFTSCGMRRMYGKTSPMEPSLFLREIDREGLCILGDAPYGFALPGKAAHGGRSASYSGAHSGAAKPKPIQSSDGKWQVGNKIYNDDRGYGAVTEIRESEDGPVIKVIFENGGESRFLSLHQSSNYTRISEDD
jgi:DNA helicase-2/ATP-dependent DNA helicase PcrA